MKDALGHGSNAGGGQPKSSNAEASKSFIRTLGKIMQPVPVHSAMGVSPYAHGGSVRRSGGERTDNPHSPHSDPELHSEWDRGFRQASRGSKTGRLGQ